MLGIPVEKVYGFVICEPKCKDLKPDEYAVGLLKLTSPQGIGNNFSGGQYIRTYKTKSSEVFSFLSIS